MDSTTIPNDHFLAVRNFANENDPVAITLPLSGVILSGEGYKQNYVDLVLKDGVTRTYVVPAFFKQLAKMLNFNIGIKTRMDEDTFGELLQTIKILQTRHKNVNEVTVVYDKIQRKLTHITNGTYNRISNSKLFDFASGIVSQNPELRIIEVLGGETSSDTEIRILSSEQIGLVDVESNEPEEFQFGIVLSNRGAQTSIGDFAYRLVCSNGMMGIRTDDRFKLGGTDTDNLFQLFEHFEKMAKANYIPEDFNENVSTASTIPASMSELMNVYKTIVSGLSPEFPDQKLMLEEAIKTRFFPELSVIEQKLTAKGVDYTDLTPKQMQLVKSDKSMWELINIATDLGSNNSIYPLTNKHTLQRLGGRLLTKPFDLTDIHLLML